MTRQPEQRALFAVWVKVDDAIGWRIVHEGYSEADCIKMAVTHVSHQYPVLNVEVRELLDHDDAHGQPPTTKLYEYPGEMP